MVRIFWLTALFACATSFASDSTPYRPELTRIEPDCSTLGPAWQAQYGITINDFSNLQGISSADLSVAERLRDQVQPLGIIGAADYSCSTREGPLDIATVRVFVFKDSALASEWWEKKYQYDGWEDHYTRPVNAEHRVLDSTQSAKRVLLARNLWITSHHIQPGTEHLMLLASIESQLGID